MLEALLRSFAVAATAFLLTGWALFSIDEARTASNATAAEIAGLRAAAAPAPYPAQERARERRNSSLRELVDDVNDVLLGPFTVVAEDAQGVWTRRTVPALMGLLVFGLGAGFLARFAAGR